MPSMWLISRASPAADFFGLPSVLRASIKAHDSLLRFYYISLRDDVDEHTPFFYREYWTICWDSNKNVDESYYMYQHSSDMKYAFVRMDNVCLPPIASDVECSWADVRGYVHNSILETALDLYSWSANARQLSRPMHPRSQCVEANMKKIINRSMWLQCYWCGYWVENPKDIDGTGCPLCNRCFEWYVAGGGPYEPTALQRIERQLRCVRPTLPEILCKDIASFLHNWHEP